MNTEGLKKEAKTTKKVKTISGFIAVIEKLYKVYGDSILIFRGHKSTSYLLKPAIGRMQGDKEKLKKLEISMFNDFCRLYYPYTELRPTRKFDMLFLAQHYRLPTRLLDWTFNPLIALYIACEEVKEEEVRKNRIKKDGEVYVKLYAPKNAPLQCGDDDKKDIGLDKKEIGNDNPFEPSDKLKPSRVIMPDNIDIRYRNQQGIFEYFANPWNESKRGIVNRIVIPSEVKESFLEVLSCMGIDEKFIYPDMEHLTSSLKMKYERMTTNNNE